MIWNNATVPLIKFPSLVTIQQRPFKSVPHQNLLSEPSLDINNRINGTPGSWRVRGLSLAGAFPDRTMGP